MNSDGGAYQAINLDPKAAQLVESVNELKSEYGKSRDIGKLDEIASLLLDARSTQWFIELPPARRFYIVSILALEYLERYSVTNERSDLQHAIDEIQLAIKQFPEGDTRAASYINSLAVTMRRMDALVEQEPIITESIRLHELAIEIADEDDEEHASFLTNVGNAYRQLNDATGKLNYLDLSIHWHERAIASSSPNEAVHTTAMSNCGNAYRQKSQQSGAKEDLAKAIELQRQSIELDVGTQSEKSLYLFGLAISLHQSYELTKDPNDLNEGIAILTRSFKLTPKTERAYLRRGALLARLVRLRFEHSEALEDLNYSLELTEWVAENTLHRPELNAQALSDLSIVRRRIFQASGDIHMLDQAIEAQEQFVNALQNGDPRIAEAVADLAVLRVQMSDYLPREQQLLQAEKDLVLAVDLAASDQSELVARCFHNLAIARRGLYRETNNDSYLDNAIAARESSINNTPPDSSELVGRIAEYGKDLIAKFQHSNDPLYLDQAIDELNQALELDTATQLDHAHALFSSAEALARRHSLNSSNEDLKLAIQRLRSAAEIASRFSFFALLTISRAWGFWALERESWSEAAEAFESMLDASDQLVQVQVLRRHKEMQVTDVRELNGLAAYAQAKSGDDLSAVLALERGRARMLGEVLEYRGGIDLKALASVAPDLSAEVEATANRLISLQNQDAQKSSHDAGPELYEKLREQRTRWNDLLAAVNQAHPDQTIGLGIDEDLIFAAARIRPVLHLVPTYYGGLALLVTPAGKIEKIWLPELTTFRLYNFLQRVESIFAQTGNIFSRIEAICGWAWKYVMKTVCEKLVDHNVSRVAVVAHGQLGLLPLHAAYETSGTQSKGSAKGVLDDVTISYVPSSQALVSAEARSGNPLTSILVVEDPTGSLPAAPTEAAAVLNRFSVKDLIGGEAATPKAVIARMHGTNILHFCTHGFFNPSSPLDSGLELAKNEVLTLRQIHEVPADRLRLVVLSACESGIIASRWLDEAIGLHTGFLQAGAPGIVATLWKVDDESTASLMDSFYEFLVSPGLSTDEALRRAQIQMRSGNLDSNGRSFGHAFYWAPFFTTGI